MPLPPPIVVARQGESWCVQLDGAVVTVHSSEAEARRSAKILAQRLPRGPDDNAPKKASDHRPG